MDIQNFASDPQDLIRALSLGLAPTSQRSARLAPMADVAVGHGHQFDMVSLGRPHRRDAADLDFAVVGMSAKADDPQLAVRRRFRGGEGAGKRCDY